MDQLVQQSRSAEQLDQWERAVDGYLGEYSRLIANQKGSQLASQGMLVAEISHVLNICSMLSIVSRSTLLGSTRGKTMTRIGLLLHWFTILLHQPGLGSLTPAQRFNLYTTDVQLPAERTIFDRCYEKHPLFHHLITYADAIHYGLSVLLSARNVVLYISHGVPSKLAPGTYEGLLKKRFANSQLAGGTAISQSDFEHAQSTSSSLSFYSRNSQDHQPANALAMHFDESTTSKPVPTTLSVKDWFDFFGFQVQNNSITIPKHVGPVQQPTNVSNINWRIWDKLVYYNANMIKYISDHLMERLPTQIEMRLFLRAKGYAMKSLREVLMAASHIEDHTLLTALLLPVVEQISGNEEAETLWKGAVLLMRSRSEFKVAHVLAICMRETWGKGYYLPLVEIFQVGEFIASALQSALRESSNTADSDQSMVLASEPSPAATVDSPWSETDALPPPYMLSPTPLNQACEIYAAVNARR